MRFLLTSRVVALLVGIALVLTACGENGDASGCIEIREPEDPASLRHILDPDAAVFQTHPPTSGPHLSGPALSGFRNDPVTPAAQVRALEDGSLVVQYSAAIDADELRPLLEIDTYPVLLAPGEDLPTPVVATTWTWKLTCDGVDVERITEFATARVAAAPGLD